MAFCSERGGSKTGKAFSCDELMLAKLVLCLEQLRKYLSPYGLPVCADKKNGNNSLLFGRTENRGYQIFCVNSQPLSF